MRRYFWVTIILVSFIYAVGHAQTVNPNFTEEDIQEMIRKMEAMKGWDTLTFKQRIIEMYWPEESSNTSESFEDTRFQPGTMRFESLGLLAMYVGWGTSRFDTGAFVKGSSLEDTIAIMERKRAINRRAFLIKVTVITLSALAIIFAGFFVFHRWKASVRRKKRFISSTTENY